jgi:type II secretory pathway pseudopilin PulG
MAVVAILAICTAGVGLSLAHTVQKSGFDAQTDRARHLERNTRNFCANHGQPAKLIFDLNAQTISRTDYTNGAPVTSTLLQLPSDTRLDRFTSANNNSNTGRFAISYSHHGYSQTFGLRFLAPDQTARWLVFAGQTGQVITYENDNDANAFFAMLGGGAQ